MDDGYEVVEHNVGEGRSLLVLRSKSSNGDFLSKLRSRKRDRSKYQQIVHVATRIDAKGEETYPSNIRVLDSSVSLIEIKVGASVIRVMAHMHDIDGRRRPILLFDFKGHQGSNRIPVNDMRRARKLAVIASNCADS